VGIAVDHRRQNRSVEGFEANVARLKEYKAKLVVLPRKVKKGETKPVIAEQVLSTASAFPIAAAPTKDVVTRAISAEEKQQSAFRTLRLACSDKKYKGTREKRAREKAEAEAEKKK
jgi:large subunit ribosomal protein L13e